MKLREYKKGAMMLLWIVGILVLPIIAVSLFNSVSEHSSMSIRNIAVSIFILSLLLSFAAPPCRFSQKSGGEFIGFIPLWKITFEVIDKKMLLFCLFSALYSASIGCEFYKN
ncbi:MAG: hypothetical protein GXZ13_02630 [Synergistaceae bacterium]|nr:hypothetical protein [Synergistaceae bacterium]